MPVATRPRLGFLGVGWIGRSRLDAIAADGCADVAAIADPAVPGALGSCDDLLELDLDGIVIATPNALHAEQAVAALEHGVPVFVQKPVGRSAAEVRAVVDAARDADLLLGVDLSYRYAHAFRAVRDVLPSIGEVFATELTFHNAYGPDKEWFRDPAQSGGGCVLDLGIHLVDLAVWLLDLEPESVTSRLIGSPVETWATAELDHVRIACSWDIHAGRDAAIEMTLYGTDGGLRVANVSGSFYDLRAERFRGTAREALAEPPDAWPGRAAVEWARRLAQGERFDAESAGDLVRVAEILDRIYGR
ncbi:MAG: Gfo/Idh/MocA family protein [Gaiellaceae bacterium]